ncbi:4-fold beta flower protein [Amphibiibacter pelophylacis]|uniref:Uncharacterized protein n=1 Tax=Amphibiibacter pelophylacis TaxID=1799477 RepID=A0ACC6P3Z8_9BURK
MLLRPTLFLAAALLAAPALAQPSETSLFDGAGQARAYITQGPQRTIYLWGGLPVAYLLNEYGRDSVVGFNGRHLGWFDNGTVRDVQGNIVCATAARSNTTDVEPVKGQKVVPPVPNVPQQGPVPPVFTLNWSQKNRCADYLRQGQNRSD